MDDSKNPSGVRDRGLLCPLYDFATFRRQVSQRYLSGPLFCLAPGVHFALAQVPPPGVRRLGAGELVTKATGHLPLEGQWATLAQQRLPYSFDAWLAAHPLKHTAEGTSQVSQKRLDLLRRHYDLENEFLAAQQAELQWLHESTPRPAAGGRPRIPDEKLKEGAAIYPEAKSDGEHAPAKAFSRHST